MHASSTSLFILSLCLAAYTITTIVTIRKDKFGYIIVAFCIYHIAFLFLPALFHTANNLFPFYASSHNEEIQVKTAIICMAFTIFFLAGFFLTHPVSKKKYSHDKFKISRNNFNIAITIIATALIGVIAVYGLNNFLIPRKDFSNAAFGGDATTGTIIVTASRAASFLIVLFTLRFKQDLAPISFYTSLAVAITLFTIINFPLSLSRYLFFSYILAILYIHTEATTKNKLLLFLAFSVGTITIFPFFNFITRGTSDSFELAIFDYYTTSGDFDGYQSIINVVKFTEDHFFTYGGQIIGALFIFVPRSIWVDKPFATGQIAAENMGYQFTNISSPLISELYIDFGYFGVTILAFLTGVVIRKIDSYSITSKTNNNQSGILVCAVIFSLSLIVLRGALIGVASTVALELLMAFFLAKFTVKKTRPKQQQR